MRHPIALGIRRASSALSAALAVRRLAAAVIMLVQQSDGSRRLDPGLSDVGQAELARVLRRLLQLCARDWAVMLFDAQAVLIACQPARLQKVRSMDEVRRTRQLQQLLQAQQGMPQIFWREVPNLQRSDCVQLDAIGSAADRIGSALRSFIAAQHASSGPALRAAR